MQAGRWTDWVRGKGCSTRPTGSQLRPSRTAAQTPVPAPAPASAAVDKGLRGAGRSNPVQSCSRLAQAVPSCTTAPLLTAFKVNVALSRCSPVMTYNCDFPGSEPFEVLATMLSDDQQLKDNILFYFLFLFLFFGWHIADEMWGVRPRANSSCDSRGRTWQAGAMPLKSNVPGP